MSTNHSVEYANNETSCNCGRQETTCVYKYSFQSLVAPHTVKITHIICPLLPPPAKRAYFTCSQEVFALTGSQRTDKLLGCRSGNFCRNFWFTYYIADGPCLPIYLPYMDCIEDIPAKGGQVTCFHWYTKYCQVTGKLKYGRDKVHGPVTVQFKSTPPPFREINKQCCVKIETQHYNIWGLLEK